MRSPNAGKTFLGTTLLIRSTTQETPNIFIRCSNQPHDLMTSITPVPCQKAFLGMSTERERDIKLQFSSNLNPLTFCSPSVLKQTQTPVDDTPTNRRSVRFQVFKASDGFEGTDCTAFKGAALSAKSATEVGRWSVGSMRGGLRLKSAPAGPCTWLHLPGRLLIGCKWAPVAPNSLFLTTSTKQLT